MNMNKDIIQTKSIEINNTKHRIAYFPVIQKIRAEISNLLGTDTQESAMYTMTRCQKILVATVACFYAVALFLNWHLTLIVTLMALTLMYFFDFVFNVFLVFRSFSKDPEIKVTEQEIADVSDSDWPSYTVFCPLYKEWQVVPQFLSAMNMLVYPREKLQIIFLLEEDDTETINKVREYDLPSFFEILVVPHSLPKTKPKACNYGLARARGEYVVIYDAEDMPDPLQLKKAVLAFKKTDKRTFCIQAKLNFYNPRQNILTKIFTAEYSLWFDLILTGLQSINAPIPLGGTSNHFQTKNLKKLSGWDPFNVTEDCDLGIRLAKRGYRTAIMDSTTYEEANSALGNWMRQRSRWIKGYIQTYLVHMRNPMAMFKSWREPHLLTFQLIVGGKILSMFVNPLLWLTTIIYFAFRSAVGPVIDSFFPDYILQIAVLTSVLGNFFYMYNYMIGCAKRGSYDLIKYAYLVPFYWLLISAAAWVAIYDIIIRPHYWAKTTHGLHLDKVPGFAAVRARAIANTSIAEFEIDH